MNVRSFLLAIVALDNGWGSPGFLGPIISFDHDGVQTIRIQVREDGLGIDQIVLSSGKWIQQRAGSGGKRRNRSAEAELV